MEKSIAAIITMHIGNQAVELFEVLSAGQPCISDALILLQGDRLDRVPATVHAYKTGCAPMVVVTGNNDLIGRGKRNDENDIHLLELKKALTRQGVLEKAIMIEDASMNTKDQAVHMVALAKKSGWKSMTLVTSPCHLLRAYLSFVKQAHDQQWQGKLCMVAADLRWDHIPDGRSKTSQEMLEVELEKIKTYSHDVASIQEGLEYWYATHS